MNESGLIKRVVGVALWLILIIHTGPFRFLKAIEELDDVIIFTLLDLNLLGAVVFDLRCGLKQDRNFLLDPLLLLRLLSWRELLQGWIYQLIDINQSFIQVHSLWLVCHTVANLLLIDLDLFIFQISLSLLSHQFF